ncbi:hypothetical protein ACOME3_006058 [Neoechinorhynchus agilis]
MVLICSKSVARRTPYNYIFLFILALSMGFVLGVISAFHSTFGVLFAIGLTLCICVGAILISLQTRFDFTKCTGIVTMLLLILVIFSISSIIFRSHVLTFLYASIGAAVMSLLLVVNLQMIMGGRQYEIGEEDYVDAAIMIYINVVNLFLCLLTLTQQAR